MRKSGQVFKSHKQYKLVHKSPFLMDSQAVLYTDQFIQSAYDFLPLTSFFYQLFRDIFFYSYVRGRIIIF